MERTIMEGRHSGMLHPVQGSCGHCSAHGRCSLCPLTPEAQLLKLAKNPYAAFQLRRVIVATALLVALLSVASAAGQEGTSSAELVPRYGVSTRLRLVEDATPTAAVSSANPAGNSAADRVATSAANSAANPAANPAAATTTPASATTTTASATPSRSPPSSRSTLPSSFSSSSPSVSARQTALPSPSTTSSSPDSIAAPTAPTAPLSPVPPSSVPRSPTSIPSATSSPDAPATAAAPMTPLSPVSPVPRSPTSIPSPKLPASPRTPLSSPSSSRASSSDLPDSSLSPSASALEPALPPLIAEPSASPPLAPPPRPSTRPRRPRSPGRSPPPPPVQTPNPAPAPSVELPPAPAPAPEIPLSPSPAPAPSPAPTPAPAPSPAPSSAPAPAPAPLTQSLLTSSAKCPGIIIDYRVLSLTPIPFSGAPAYQFKSRVTLSNVGPTALRKWELSFGYVNQEAIGDVDGAVVPAGVQLPVAGSGLLLSSPPGIPFLLTAVQSGGDKRRYQHVIQLAGTEVAATSAAAALPRGIWLDAKGFTCNDQPMLSGRPDTLRVCCPSTGPVQDTQVAAVPIPALPIAAQGLQVQWDVVASNNSQYTVAVRVTNTMRYTAISSDPGWSLQWAWQMGEMILECDGCQTLEQGDCTSCPACIDNPTIKNAYSCDPIPTVVDGSSLNGSLSAAAYDNSSSSTSFTMTLVKAQQYWDPSLLTFPANFSAQVSNQSQGFACGPPTPVSPSALETVTGGRQTTNAKASYVVTCGTVAGNGPLPTCSVSASAYFNTSLAPCSSCACSCSSSNTSQNGGQCDAATSASTDPAATVLLGDDLAGLVVPGQGPGSCGTGCGIQAHVTVSDADETGWTMRVALWNSAPPTIKNWTAVLAFPQGFAENLQEASSVVAQFDSPPYADNLMISGQPTVNEWLLGDGGNVQWTLRFNRTPASAGYNATGGADVAVSSGVFPLAVLVGGQQCQMPTFLPTAKESGSVLAEGVLWSVAVAVLVWGVLCV